MPYCRFFKVDQSTNWVSLKENSQTHKLNMRKTLQYKILTTIVLNHNEFNGVCEKLHLPNSVYKEYASSSVAGLDGIFNCIVLREENENRKLIIYTAGEMYPLYVGIDE